MTSTQKTYRIFLSAAEPSADAHCANLIKALKATGHNFEFVGLGGQQMADAGCTLIENMAARAAMHYKVLGQIGYYIKLLGRIKAYYAANPIDLTIVCDSPAFNFRIAKIAKKANVKTMFYVAPQLWAWGRWRLAKTRRLCTKLACILPFEQDWFTTRGIDATFVGNPLFDHAPEILAGTRAKRTLNLDKPRIALMPGSRQAELDTLWLPMQQIAIELAKKFPTATFTAVAANESIKTQLQDRQLAGLKISYDVSAVIASACKSDLTIVASGSATLQVAAAGCPMAVIYQSNKFLWHLIGKHLLKTRHLSLVNILAGKELVPEFMPYFDSIEPITASCVKILTKHNLAQTTSRNLIELTNSLVKSDASAKTAQIVLNLLD